jgi:hypothetical protein
MSFLTASSRGVLANMRARASSWPPGVTAAERHERVAAFMSEHGLGAADGGPLSRILEAGGVPDAPQDWMRLLAGAGKEV